jgi:predicted nucleic acid-binding protein
VSYSVDVNLLLYATDRSSPWHEQARKFIEGRALDPELFCLAWPTLMCYLRMATHPRIFAEPLTPVEALGNVAALLALPHARALAELEGC